MMTVTGTVTRQCLGLDSFADLTPGIACVAITATGVEFASDLTPTQVAAVRARMTSRDDDDQMARANIADLTAAARTGGIEDIRALVVAVADYARGAIS